MQGRPGRRVTGRTHGDPSPGAQAVRGAQHAVLRRMRPRHRAALRCARACDRGASAPRSHACTQPVWRRHARHARRPPPHQRSGAAAPRHGCVGDPGAQPCALAVLTEVTIADTQRRADDVAEPCLRGVVPRPVMTPATAAAPRGGLRAAVRRVAVRSCHGCTHHLRARFLLVGVPTAAVHGAMMASRPATLSRKLHFGLRFGVVGVLCIGSSVSAAAPCLAVDSCVASLAQCV